jgi:hypothetical protein
VIWVVDHLEDLESDFSVFHRIDDPLSLPGPEFFRKAHRVGAYEGVMTARIAKAHKNSAPSVSKGHSTPEETKHVSNRQFEAMHPDLIERSK